MTDLPKLSVASFKPSQFILSNRVDEMSKQKSLTCKLHWKKATKALLDVTLGTEDTCTEMGSPSAFATNTNWRSDTLSDADHIALLTA